MFHATRRSSGGFEAVKENLHRVEKSVESTVAAGSGWLRWIARFGYGARALMYFIVGALAIFAAVEHRAAAMGGVSGAFRGVLVRPTGKILVVALIVGLSGHAVWSFIQAAVDPERSARSRGRSTPTTRYRRILYRLNRLTEALVHVALVTTFVGMITGRSKHTGDISNIERWSARLMGWPEGRYLVGTIGAGVVIFGLYQLWRAWRVELDEMLRLQKLDRAPRRAVINISRIGIAARGVVSCMLGVWMIVAARTADARQAKGLGGALRDLQSRPYGPWLMSAVAVGLIAYALYELLRATHRQIGPRA
jgi:hypothetical protein